MFITLFAQNSGIFSHPGGCDLIKWSSFKSDFSSWTSSERAAHFEWRESAFPLFYMTATALEFAFLDNLIIFACSKSQADHDLTE